MPMRTECKHFESRSYPNGDTVRKCNLDLAPDAPWRCPENCARYERRLADAAWTHGSLQFGANLIRTGHLFYVLIRYPGRYIGETIPELEDFSLEDQSGTSQRLSTMLESGPLVLFFYPKAMTPG